MALSTHNDIKRIYVGNIDYNIENKEIEKVFSKYGKILELELERGYCFIEY